MAYVSSVSRATSLSDRFLLALSGVLLGYAMMGRGFAYLGFSPLFIGEIAFFVGSIILLRTGCLIAALASLPSLFLAAIMTWVLVRTSPFIDAYGFEALRDSIVIMYGGFAFIVIALVLEDARRVDTIVRYYAAFLSIYVPAIPFIFAFHRFMAGYVPHVPGTFVPLLSIKSGEVAVHLAGAAVFVLAGLRRATLLWTLLLVAALAMACAFNRGGMLAFVIPVAFAALVLGRIRELATVLVTGLVIFVAAYTAETTLTDDREAGADAARRVSTRQIVANVESIFGYADKNLEGSKRWRLEWWSIIIKDTVFGSNFWSGRGFGLNLATADGFGSDRDTEPLRSPHNAHMTILARAGVPGLALWAALLASWVVMVMRAMWTARRRGEVEWAGLFLWIGCYVMSIVINASFDVTLEGPVQGVWFWCLIGFGIGSAMVYRHQTILRLQEYRARRPMP